jgi:hypothetical protein
VRNSWQRNIEQQLAELVRRFIRITQAVGKLVIGDGATIRIAIIIIRLATTVSTAVAGAGSCHHHAK